MKKNLEIQYLRVVAIVLVAITHRGILFTSSGRDPLNGIEHYFSTWVGVDIFFVISGYLMGAILLGRTTEINTVEQKLEQTILFLKKRFLRLFPASFFWVTVVLLLGSVSGDSAIWAMRHDLFAKWVASIFQIRNFENSLHPSSLGWYWSLSLENQFYFILPLVWFSIGKRYFWWFIMTLAVALLVWSPGGSNWFWFRPTGFVWGLLVYKIMSNKKLENIFINYCPKWGALASLITVTTILVCSTNAPNSIGEAYMPLAISLISFVTACILAFASLNRGFIKIPAFMESTIFWMAEMSYSFYLCHMVVFCALNDFLKRYHILLGTTVKMEIGFTIASICSILTYFYIERLFYKPKDNVITPKTS